jgi:hypothetical protein
MVTAIVSAYPTVMLASEQKLGVSYSVVSENISDLRASRK